MAIIKQRPFGSQLPTRARRNLTCNAGSGLGGISRRAFIGGIASVAYVSDATKTGAQEVDVADPAAPTLPSRLGFERAVSEFTLPNGLHFIVLERHVAPVVSCHVYCNVGAWDEEDGKTGLAHLLEHMAFKGTSSIGSKDYAAEARVLAACDEVFYELRAASAAGQSERAQQLEARLQQLQESAQSLCQPNAYGSLLTSRGAVGLNASTSHDQTRYYVSLPANALELWFAMESERFQDPVFRGLYSEKRVIVEERRMRVDSSPIGRWQQQYLLTSLANNYRRPVIGFTDDFEGLGRAEVADFFGKHYGPARTTIALVGDVTPDQAYKLASKYFGGWQAPGLQPKVRPALAPGPLPRPPGFQGCSSFSDAAPAGPALMVGYYRPSMLSEEGARLDVLGDILAGSRTSRFQTNVVQAQRALSASVTSGFPGELQPGLCLVTGVPNQGDALDVLDRRLGDELTRLVNDGVSGSELSRVKRTARAGLLAAAQSNATMASALAYYHAAKGSWRALEDDLLRLDALQPGELLATAQQVFSDDNCFKGYVLPNKA